MQMEANGEKRPVCPVRYYQFETFWAFEINYLLRTCIKTLTVRSKFPNQPRTPQIDTRTQGEVQVSCFTYFPSCKLELADFFRHFICRAFNLSNRYFEHSKSCYWVACGGFGSTMKMCPYHNFHNRRLPQIRSAFQSLKTFGQGMPH